jgi:hypothetical protein
MEQLPSYRDFTPLLGTMRLPAIPHSPLFELSRQKNPQPPDSVRRSVYEALHELHIVRQLQWSRVAPEAFMSDYSYRSATIGSTLAARRAGNKLAVRAKAMSTRAAVTNVAGSAGEMPKRS